MHVATDVFTFMRLLNQNFLEIRARVPRMVRRSPVSYERAVRGDIVLKGK